MKRMPMPAVALVVLSGFCASAGAQGAPGSDPIQLGGKVNYLALPTAPTKPVWSQKGGAPFVTDIDPVTGAPVIPPNGTWVTFSPKE